MSARRLDGKAVAAAIKHELRERVTRLAERGITPGLATLLVGDDPASHAYVNYKHRDCREIGVKPIPVSLPASASQTEVAQAIENLNADPEVTGFIVQLPLPRGIDEQAMLQLIDPAKDADGLHPVNLGKLVLGIDAHGPDGFSLPCTPVGIVELLRRHDVTVSGKHAVIIGRGTTVGRPLALLLSGRGMDATVTQVHSRTRDVAALVHQADIVVAAAGAPHMVKPDWVKPGAVVLDVGVTRVGTTDSGKARLAGDVDPAVADVAGWLSPNPGGVGPMTRAMLVANVVAMAEHASRMTS